MLVPKLVREPRRTAIDEAGSKRRFQMLQAVRAAVLRRPSTERESAIECRLETVRADEPRGGQTAQRYGLWRGLLAGLLLETGFRERQQQPRAPTSPDCSHLANFRARRTDCPTWAGRHWAS